MAATCTTCGKKIRVPQGWSVGAAVRRHYWSKHREVMMGRRADAQADKAVLKRVR